IALHLSDTARTTWEPKTPASKKSVFYNPLTQLRRHLIHITLMHRQFVGDLLVRHVESHEIETQHPDFQRLMMAGKDGVGQIITALVTVVTLVALTGGD